MTTPANPLDNQDAIARIEATCASNAEAIRLLVTELVPAIRLDAERTSELTKRADARSTENEARFNNLLAEARADRDEWRAEFKAQQEILQTLLVELAKTNRNVSNLSERVNELEQAS